MSCEHEPLSLSVIDKGSEADSALPQIRTEIPAIVLLFLMPTIGHDPSAFHAILSNVWWFE